MTGMVIYSNIGSTGIGKRMSGKKVAAKIRQALAINDGEGLRVGHLATKPVQLIMKEPV